MSNRNLILGAGAGIAVLLGLIFGLTFGWGGGGKRTKGATPVAAATREPDATLQVVVAPTGKAAAAKPVAVANAVVAPRPTPVAARVAPLASASPSTASQADGPAQPNVEVAVERRPTLAVRPAPLRIPPARAQADDDEGADAPPPYRAAPMRPAPPRYRRPPEPDDDDEDDGGPPPPPPPPGWR